MRARTRSLAVGLAALVAVSAAATGAVANDSSAELATGGLVLTKNPAIEMRSEDRPSAAPARPPWVASPAIPKGAARPWPVASITTFSIRPAAASPPMSGSDAAGSPVAWTTRRGETTKAVQEPFRRYPPAIQDPIRVTVTAATALRATCRFRSRFPSAPNII